MDVFPSRTTVKDKIIGMFLGTIIGDALGMPVETMSFKEIKEKHGRITNYLSPVDHKWFKDSEIGTYTDDFQLTLAVAKGLIEDAFSLDSQIKYHIEAFKETTSGWGNSTRNSIRRLINGGDIENSYEKPTENGKGIGGGNGVPMKISPLGLLLSNRVPVDSSFQIRKVIFEFIASLSKLTHGTSISICAGISQALMIKYCIDCYHPENFLKDKTFLQDILESSNFGKQYFVETVNDDLTERLKDLYLNLDDYNDEKIINSFGYGSCYCYNSIPFSHAFFLKNPTSIDCLFDCISSGGDTDSNGSMVGAMLGALNGYKIFPQYLIDGLKNPKIAFEIGELFHEKFFNYNW